MPATSKSRRTWFRVNVGGNACNYARVPAGGVLFWRRGPDSGRLQVAMLVCSQRRGGALKLDVFGGKCEAEDGGIEGTMTREFAEEMYYERQVSCAMLRLCMQGARRALPGGKVAPAPKRAPGRACELVLLAHKDPKTFSFACLIAPCPKKLSMPSPSEYAAARTRAMQASVPPVDYCSELGATWVDYAELATGRPGATVRGVGAALGLEHRMHLILDQQHLLDELAEDGAPCYSKPVAPPKAEKTHAVSEARAASGSSTVVSADVDIVAGTGDGLVVSTETGDGVVVSTETGDGVVVSTETDDGVVVSTETGDGVVVSTETGDGVVVSTETDDGVVVSTETGGDVVVSTETGGDVVVSTETGDSVVVSIETGGSVVVSIETGDSVVVSTETGSDVVASDGDVAGEKATAPAKHVRLARRSAAYRKKRRQSAKPSPR